MNNSTSHISRTTGTILAMLMCLCIFSAGAQSAEQAPIRWRMIVKMTSPTEGTVTVKALVSDGWHLYGTSMPKGGPRPTVLDFSGSQGVEFIGDATPSTKPVVKADRQFGAELSQWESSVNFVRRFRLKKGAVKPTVKLNVSFMGCNDATCLPPRTETFTSAVPEFKK